MAKKLIIKFPQKCIGCEMCVMEVQRQLQRFGLENSPIRIFRKVAKDKTAEKEVEYEIHMDDSVHELNLGRIVQICPTGVFSIEESPEKDDLLS